MEIVVLPPIFGSLIYLLAMSIPFLSASYQMYKKYKPVQSLHQQSGTQPVFSIIELFQCPLCQIEAARIDTYFLLLLNKLIIMTPNLKIVVKTFQEWPRESWCRIFGLHLPLAYCSYNSITGNELPLTGVYSFPF